MTYDTQGRRVLQGHPSTWPQEVEQLRARVQELEAFAKDCASYTCTCHEAYVGRQMVDPSCMAGEIGYEAQEVLGQPVTCRGILAARKRWSLQKQEGE